MGNMYDYFSAPSDEAAAHVVNLPGGPGVPVAGPSRLGPAEVELARAQEGAPFDTVPITGIDPVVKLCTLEALLTGRDYKQIAAGPRAGQALASRHGGQCVVVTLTDELQAALADADDEQLAAVAVPWSRTEAFWGRGDPQSLTRLLHELAELARRARSRDEHMYCWACD